MAIISSDVDAIKERAEMLGVGELYGLFACMTSGRSWNAIQSGIDMNKKTNVEEKEIKDDASKYLVRPIFPSFVAFQKIQIFQKNFKNFQKIKNFQKKFQVFF